MKTTYWGLMFALLAASCNATIGIFSVYLMNSGMPPFAIAFYKCLLAFIMVVLWLCVSGKFIEWLNYLKLHCIELAVCAIFGFFVLHFFETNAYHYEKVPAVVFLLLGSATLSTFVLSAIINKRMLCRIEIISCILATIGLGLIFRVSSYDAFNGLGVILAVVAGMGYGIFLTLSAFLRIGSGLHVVGGLLLFGTLYLLPPFVYYGGGCVHTWLELLLLICLAVIPTILGFWCTIKALTLIRSESVQLFELSEPLISLLFAFVFLHQVLGLYQLLGGLCVLVAIYISMRANMMQHKTKEKP